MKTNLLLAFVVGLGVGLAVAFLKPGPHGVEAETQLRQIPDERPASTLRKAEPGLVKGQKVPEIRPLAPADQGPGPTPEEQLALKELVQRRRAGEYVLQSENPFALRMRRESLKEALATAVPPMITARQEFLGNLDVAQENIAKLTNHAAKIAEASFAASSVLTEISIAKIEYDQKARDLLTPEQYERFKDFEVRAALEKEWQRFNVEKLDDLPISDLRAVTRSMEELGIREKTSSTILPYEPEPSSGNRLSAEHRNIQEILAGKISKLDAASADIDVIADRHQLSNEARRLLASMIASRRHSLQKEISGLQKPDEEQADFFRKVLSSQGRPPK